MELMVASMSFVVVFTGLAFFFQSNIAVSKMSDATSLCLRHYKDGIRTLAHDDPRTGHAGLKSARRVYLCPDTVFGLLATPSNRPEHLGQIDRWIEYQVDISTYQVWLENGQLFRNKDFLATSTLMGDDPIPVCATYVPLIVATYADEPWQVLPANGVASAMVRMPLRLFQDVDGFKRIEDTEAEVGFAPAFYLGRSE